MNVFKTTMLAGTILAAAGQAALVHGQTMTIEQRVKALEDAQKKPSAPHPKSGNKNVTLQIDGHVNQGALYFNDSRQDYVNYVDGNASHSRFRFTGSGKIDNKSGVAARIEVGVQPNSTTAVSQTTQSTGSSGANLDIRKAEVWYRNDEFGQVSLGQGDMASNDTSHADLSGTALAGNSTPADIAGGVIFRDKATGALDTTNGPGGGAMLIKNAFDDYDGLSRKERIRYDSPTIAGFVLSGSHNGQQEYDVALVQTGQYGSFKVWAAGAYSRDTGKKFDLYNGSFSILHVPTGLSVTVAGGKKDFDASGTNDPNFYYAKLGYQTMILPVGKTAISGDYYHSEDTVKTGDKATGWSFAVVQKIDVASMEAYLTYHNYDYKQVGFDFDQVDAVMAGARVKF